MAALDFLLSTRLAWKPH